MKKEIKKLKLKKITVTRLNNSQLMKIVGKGVSDTDPLCPLSEGC